MNKNLLYRSIPKVDILLENEDVKALIEKYNRDTVMESIHVEMDKLRKYIGQCDDEEKAKKQIELAKKEENEGKTIVVILPDSGDRYLSTEMFRD